MTIVDSVCVMARKGLNARTPELPLPRTSGRVIPLFAVPTPTAAVSHRTNPNNASLLIIKTPIVRDEAGGTVLVLTFQPRLGCHASTGDALGIEPGSCLGLSSCLLDP